MIIIIPNQPQYSGSMTSRRDWRRLVKSYLHLHTIARVDSREMKVREVSKLAQVPQVT